ncbi:hypothetical protein JW823_01920 [bacterium]|nr:hypothetical protein [candidate division CSSED10-310 bacterium]
MNPWITRIIIYGFLAEVIYLAVANVMLSGGILHTLVNRRPEKQHYEWESAWTIVPGMIHVRGFTMRTRTPSTAWTISIDHAWFTMSLPALVLRSFRVTALHANGVESSIRRRPRLDTLDTTGTTPAKREIAPFSFTSVENKPLDGDPQSPGRPHWHIRLKRIVVDDVRSLNVEHYQWIGHGVVRGSLEMITRASAYVPRAKVNLANGAISLRGRTISEKLDISGDMQLGPYEPRKNRGVKALDFLTAHARVSGDVSEIAFLDYYFRSLDWLTISGCGEVDADLLFERGLFLEDSFLTCRLSRIETRINNWAVSGAGVLRGSVGRIGDLLESSFAVDLNNISLWNGMETSDPIHSPGLTMRLTGRNIRIDDPDPDFDVSLQLVDSSIADLSLYNNLFPAGSGFEILPGSPCRLDLNLEMMRRSAEGRLSLSGSETGIRFRNQDFRGHFLFSALFESNDLQMKLLRIKDVTLKLHDVAQTAASQRDPIHWNAELKIPDSTILMNHPVSIASRIEFLISDSRPVQSILLPNGNTWFEDLIRFENLSGQAGIKISEGTMKSEDAAFFATGVIPDQFGIQPFNVHASFDSFDLRNGLDNLQLSFKIPPSTIPDLGSINPLLPPDSGILFRPGDSGTMEADVRVTGKNGQGKLRVDGTDIGLMFFDQIFEGNFDLKIGLNSRDIMSGIIDLAGSTISLTDLRSLDGSSEPGWWSSLEAVSGTMLMGKPLTIRTELMLKMRDTGPILSIFQEQSQTVKWLGDILLVRNIEGTALFHSDADGLHCPDLNLKGENLDVKARLRLSKDRFRGIMYTKFRGLSIGVDVKNGRKSYRLIHPRRWFDDYQWEDKN